MDQGGDQSNSSDESANQTVRPVTCVSEKFAHRVGIRPQIIVCEAVYG